MGELLGSLGSIPIEVLVYGAERGQTIVVKDESCNLHDLGPVLREFIRCVPTAIQTVC